MTARPDSASGRRRCAVALAAFFAWLLLAGSAYAAEGTWDRAWGKDVISGNAETGFEICTVAAACKPGSNGGLGGEFGGVFGVATDAAGAVYVVDSAARIHKFDSAGNWERAWGKDVISGNAETGFEICTVAAACKAGSTGGLGGEINSPRGIGTDPSGAIYLADLGNHRIQKFDSSGTFLRAWGKDVDTAAGTGFEVCIAANGDTCQAGTAGGLGGEFNFPIGVATDPAGAVYVTEGSNNRVQKFDSSGNWQRAWGKDVDSVETSTGFEICMDAADCQGGTAGGLGGELNFPAAIAADAAGGVYVSDFGNHRIQTFDASGSFQRTWGKDVDMTAGDGFEVCTAAADCQAGMAGGLGGELSSPRGVATDAVGAVYVADQDNQRIQKFDSSGNFQRAWGRDVDSLAPGTGFEICTVAANCQTGMTGGLGGELFTPYGIATDAAGSLYASELENNRVQRFADPPETPPPPPDGVATATKPGRTLTLDANKNKVKKGKSVTLSGRVTEVVRQGQCESGQSVELQRKKPSQAAFTTIEQLQTNAAGSFTTKEKVKKTFEYRAQVSETATCGSAASNTERVKVKKS
jgi:NHL repeat